MVLAGTGINALVSELKPMGTELAGLGSSRARVLRVAWSAKRSSLRRSYRRSEGLMTLE